MNSRSTGRLDFRKFKVKSKRIKKKSFMQSEGAIASLQTNRGRLSRGSHRKLQSMKLIRVKTSPS